MLGRYDRAMRARQPIGGAPFTPRSIGAAVWYDPSDLTQAKATWRRNLLTYSESFDNAAWTKAGTTVTANAVAAPDGTNTADLIVETAATSPHYFGNEVVLFTAVSGTSYTQTIYAKYHSKTYLQLTFGATKFGSQYGVFNLSTGAVASQSNGVATITDVGGGWYRCSWTATATAGGLEAGYYGLVNTTGTRLESYLGNVTIGTYVWGAQLEVGSTATTYQKITDYNTEFLAAFPSHALYQDSAGTTPVTAVEQPVGLILDKSQGLVLGAELVANGTFDSGTTGWNVPAGWAVGSGVATGTATNASLVNLTTSVQGRAYLVEFDYTHVSGTLYVSVGANYAGAVTFSSSGRKSVVLVAGASSNRTVEFYGGAITGSIDNVSCKEIPGNHLIQPTTTKRPIYSRRVNLLTKTEQFADAIWVKAEYGGGLPPTVIENDAPGPASDGFADKVTFSAAGAGAQSLLVAMAAFSPSVYRGVLCLKAASPGDVGKIIALRHAAGSAYLLITLTADYQVIIRDETALGAVVGSLDIVLRPDVGTSSGEVSMHLAYASLTLATDAHLPYQLVNTETDYDADPAKFPAYLSFDGVDDALQTGNIDFTGTDKMTVWAGVTKLSDAAAGMLVELSANVNTNNGSFYIAAPNTAGTFNFASKGTADVLVSRTGFNAPISAVLVMQSNIAAPTFDTRVNGVASTTSTSSQGTGNYGNYPLYIGARAGTTLYFNGRLYSLIVRGAQSSLSQIEATEAHIKQKMRLP